MSKVSDFVTTAAEKQDAAQHLLSTEQTDAINSGIVGSQRATPKSYTPSARSHKIGSLADGETLHTQTAAEAFQEENLTSNSHAIHKSHIGKRATRASAQEGIRKSVHTTLEDTELEGTDDLYYKGKRSYQTGKKAKNIVSAVRNRGVVRKNPTTLTTPTSKTGGKAAAKSKTAQKQFASYFKKNVYSHAATTSAAKTAGAATTKSLVVAGGKAIGGKFLAVGAAVVLGILACLVFLTLIISVFDGASDEEENKGGFGNLTGVQLEVAQALRAAGLGNTQIAAIMGNISGESGWNPTAVYRGQGNNTWYEYGHGLFQFTDTAPNRGNFTNFKNWAQANGKDISSGGAQTEYFIQQLPSSWGTHLHDSGYYDELSQFLGKDASYSSFLNTHDLELATYLFLACYERPADWAAESSFPTRYSEAQKFYAQLTSSGGSGNLGEAILNADTQTQKRILEAASRTPSTGAGWCAAWVSTVYQNAGLGYIGGNANDQYRNYAHNSDRSQLKPGMLVAVEHSSSGSSDGWTYGHVGIYIGGGQVIHNIGSIQIDTLDDWIAAYAKFSPAGWGYPPSVQE